MQQISEFLKDYDWKEVFEYAKTPVQPLPPTSKISTIGFVMEDVVEVWYADEGENDGNSWIMVGKLKDERFFFLSAGCDYSGWCCQAGGDACVAETVLDLVKGMTPDDRERLKIPEDFV